MIMIQIMISDCIAHVPLFFASFVVAEFVVLVFGSGQEKLFVH